MKRTILMIVLGVLTAGGLGIVLAAPPYSSHGSVAVSSTLTAVDPYANPDRANPLNPERPYWYAVDGAGLTVLKLGDNAVLGSVLWPATIQLAQPDGSMLNVSAPALGWEPVGLMVPFPDSEGIGPEAQAGATTVAFVLMAHSGYEWQSSDGVYRDTIAPMTSEATESSMLVMIDVSKPATPVVFAGALLGHDASQMAWDPGSGAMYVANGVSDSLPPGLKSFVSKITPPEAGAEPPPPYAPETLYPLCGPEIEWSGELKEEGKMGIPVNVPEVWACDTIHGAGEGEGPFTYRFDGLPAWLTAHGLDPLTGEADGILYGTPTQVGIYTFTVTVTDHDPAATVLTASAVVTLDVKPAVTEFAAGEMEVEAGIVTALPLYGRATDGLTDACATADGTTPVPAWFEVKAVPYGCVVIMNSPPLSGEYYDFSLPNLTRIDTRTGVEYAGPWQLSAEVLGTYGFDALPDGVSLSGLAWHEVDMIPGEPDKYVLNGEFFGISPAGQLYAIVLPYEGSDTIEEVGPPSLVVDTNEISTVGTTPLPGSGFGKLVVEADGDVYVAADDSVIRVTLTPGTPATDTTPATPPTVDTITPISLPGIRGAYLALDSDLEPAVKPDLGGPGQVDHNALWVTSATSGDVAAIDTHLGTVQPLSVAGATSLGGVAVDSVTTGLAYVAVPSAGNVALFGSGAAWNAAPKLAIINPAEALVDPTIMTVGEPGSVTIVATGWPIPTVSVSGAAPGLTFTANGDGTGTVSGIPTTAGVYTLTATATNGLLPDATQTFTLTVNALAPPAITSANTATLVVGIAGQFKVEATGTPTPTLSSAGALPAGVTFQDNRTGSAFLAGAAASEGSYPLTITASNSQGTVTQAFTLVTSSVLTPTPPVVTTQPVSLSVNEGDTATFTAAATGMPAPTAQWQLSLDGAEWGNIVNGTGTSYTTPATTQSMNGYQYRAVFINGIGTGVISSAATLTVNAGATLGFTSGTEAVFVVGSAGTFTVTATGSPAPSLSYTGALPESVTFTDNGNGTATVAATATAALGSYPIVITASNTQGTATQTLTVTVQDIAVATMSLPEGMAGLVYSYQLKAIGGSLPYTWSLAPIAKNSLPAGLSLSSSGTISGKSNKAGTYKFTVQVEDTLKHAATRALALTFADEGGPIKVSLQAGSEPEGIAVNPVTHTAYILSRDIATNTKNVVVIDNAVLNGHAAPKSFELPLGATAHPPTLIQIANDHEYLAIDSTRNLIYVPTKYSVPDTEAGEPPEEGDEPPVETMGTVTAIDGDTNAVLALYEFPRGYMPEATAVDPVNNVVYVAVKLPEPEDPGGCPIDPVSGQPECEVTGGMIYAFNAADVKGTPGSLGSPIAAIPAEDPESIVFNPTTRLLYAANEGKGTTSIIRALDSTGSPKAALIMELPIFSTRGFAASGPNPYALLCSPYEADKMAVGADGSVYITDDKSRVAKIATTTVAGMAQIDLPGGDNGPLYCYGEEPLQGQNTANNIAFMQVDDRQLVYVVSEQNTVSILDGANLSLIATITVPAAVHLDAIGVDASSQRVWVTDEEVNAVFVMHGACVKGAGPCTR